MDLETRLDRLEEALGRLAEAQARTEVALTRLSEAQVRTETRVGRLEEGQARLTEGQQQLSAAHLTGQLLHSAVHSTRMYYDGAERMAFR